MANGQKDVECVGSFSNREGEDFPFYSTHISISISMGFYFFLSFFFWGKNTIVDVMCNCYMSMSLWGYEWVGWVGGLNIRCKCLWLHSVRFNEMVMMYCCQNNRSNQKEQFTGTITKIKRKPQVNQWNALHFQMPFLPTYCTDFFLEMPDLMP